MDTGSQVSSKASKITFTLTFTYLAANLALPKPETVTSLSLPRASPDPCEDRSCGALSDDRSSLRRCWSFLARPAGCAIYTQMREVDPGPYTRSAFLYMTSSRPSNC
jgi:hypothetical protein